MVNTGFARSSEWVDRILYDPSRSGSGPVAVAEGYRFNP